MKALAGTAFATLLWVLMPVPSGKAQTNSASSVWTCRLLESSSLIDDCPVCDRVPIVYSLRGTFTLAFVRQTPLLAEAATTHLPLISRRLSRNLAGTKSGFFVALRLWLWMRELHHFSRVLKHFQPGHRPPCRPTQG